MSLFLIILCIVVLGAVVVVALRLRGQHSEAQALHKQDYALDDIADGEQLLEDCICEAISTMREVTRIYNRILVAVFKENRKVLRDMLESTEALYKAARLRKYDALRTLRQMQSADIGSGYAYIQIVDYLSEVTKALIHIARPTFEHIDKHHTGLCKEQITDLMRINDTVEQIFIRSASMLAANDFSDMDNILTMRDQLISSMTETIRKQLQRQSESPELSTSAGILYINILNESKTMVLQSRNLLKSQQFFLEQQHS